MPTPLPVNNYSIARLASGQSVDFGNAIAIRVDGSASYTIAGWVRLLTAGNTGQLLVKGQEFALTLSGDVLNVQMAGQVTPVAATQGLVIGEWQYFVLTFAQSSRGSGLMSLYVSGALLAQASLNNVGLSGSADFILGGDIAADFIAVNFWSDSVSAPQTMLDWDAPASGPTLAAAFSFSPGAATDLSGNNNPINFRNSARQYWVAPGLYLANAAIQPSSADGLNPGGGGNDAFSILSWVYAEAPQQEADQALTVFANGPLQGPGNLATYLAYNSVAETFTWTVQRNGAAGPTLTATRPVTPSTWHHVAVTYDGTTLILYVDGQTAGQMAAGAIPPLAEPAAWIGASLSAGAAAGVAQIYQGYLQALSVWNAALSASEIATYMTAQDPSGQPSCVAYFDFTAPLLTNSVTGNATSSYNGPILWEVDIAFPPGAEPERAARVMGPRAEWPLAAMAAARGERTVSKPKSNLISSQELDQLIAGYAARTARVPEPLRSYCRDRFTRNLYLGFQMQGEIGTPLPGTFTFKTEGGHHVFYHHTINGPQECGRVDAETTSICAAWIVSVTATAVGVLMSALGAGFVASKLINVLTTQLAQNAQRLAILTSLYSQPVTAETFVKIVRTIYAFGILTNVISQAFTGGSWWSWAFTIANLILQIAALWLTGGAFLLVILAQLALSIAQLVYVITQKPPGC